MVELVGSEIMQDRRTCEAIRLADQQPLKAQDMFPCRMTPTLMHGSPQSCPTTVPLSDQLLYCRKCKTK